MTKHRVEVLAFKFFDRSLTRQFAKGNASEREDHGMKRATRAATTLLGLLFAADVCGAQKLSLATWSFRSQNGSVRVDNATVPGTSHMHLLDAGVIEDPYLRFNEREYQWVAKETWVYETHVTVGESDVLARSNLVFENLDGVAQIYVNDKLLASTASSFLSYSFGVEKLLVQGSNAVKVVFTPPLDYANKKSQETPYFVPATQNFNVWAEPSHRSFIRKAGSDFGWDWGPAYATTGIAGSVYLEFGSSAPELTNLDVIQQFPGDQANLSVVDLTVLVSFDGKGLQHDNVTFDLLVNGVLQSTRTTNACTTSDIEDVELLYTLENPTLWWPSGYGDPYLYELKINAWNEHFNASVSHKIGIRHVALIQEPTAAGNITGKTFYFKVNQVPIYAKGANWIPTDSFPTRVQHFKVKNLIRSAFEANMNMIRVWGGGRYESDFFYSECDRLGLLVWQELMFACGMYPRDTEFLNLVNDEVRMQVKRLRKYTSIAIWGGNNENENMMEQFANGFSMPRDTPFNRDIAVADYSKLFVDVIQPIFATLDPSRPFVDTSPSNGLYSVDPFVKRWGPSNGIAYGYERDVHFYDYASDCQQSETFPHARFISEFGFQSAPSLTSLREVGSEIDWSSFQSFWTFLKFRERHANGTAEMLHQLQRRFIVPFPFSDEEWLRIPYSRQVRDVSGDFGFNISKRIDSYLYLTQIQQGLCYQTAIRTWRRGKIEDLGKTMGILYWQLNDIWQGTSWSSVEFSGRWKSLHNFVKREFAPFVLSIHQQNATGVVEVYGVSDIHQELEIEVVYELRSTKNGSVLKTTTDNLVLNPLESKKVWHVDVEEVLDEKDTSCTVTSCFLYIQCHVKSPSSLEAQTLCSDVYHFFAPYKSLDLAKGGIEVVDVQVSSASPTSFDVTIRSSSFVALFVEVETPISQGFWSENSFLMLANQEKVLTFSKFEEDNGEAGQPLIDEFKKSLSVRWLQKIYEDDLVIVEVE